MNIPPERNVTAADSRSSQVDGNKKGRLVCSASRALERCRIG